MDKLVDEIYGIITNGGTGFCFKNIDLSILKDKVKVEGYIQFNQEYKGIPLHDEYLIQILFPLDFPNKIPTVREINGRIPSSADYHNNKENDGFCLGVPGEIHEKIYSHPTFKYFISEIVIPFLYANTFREKYKTYPWITRAHFGNGLIEYYQNLFNLENEELTKKFLYNVAFSKRTMKGHIQCPCGSGKKFRNCHGALYIKLIAYHSHKDIQKDVLHILKDDTTLSLDKVLKEKMYTKKWYKLYRICLMQIIGCKK